MRHSGLFIVVAAVVLTMAVRAWASPNTVEDLLRDDCMIVDHQPTRAGGPAADTLFINRSGQDAWQQLAYNNVFSELVTLRRIDWWGFYGTFNQAHQPPSAPETFCIRL